MARASVIQYRETVWSAVFPGNRHTVKCIRPAVLGAENALELAPERRKRVVWRMDGGAGSDDQIRWLLARQYHIVVKGTSSRRAHNLAQQVSRWDPYGDVWLGHVTSPVDFGRPVQVFVKKRLKEGTFCHSYYVTTLKFPSKGHFMACYDHRGAAEVEQFRNDKSGLHLAARRKRRLPAQTALVLLTDLAHNLLAHFHHTALVGTNLEGFGPKRIVRDLLAIPAKLVFDGSQLKRIELLDTHQHAKDMCDCLKRYCSGD